MTPRQLLSPQSRAALFDAPRRLATLVVFAREREAALTDAALVMFDKMLGGVFRRADHERKENVVDRAKTLDASMRALIGMAKAMLIAKDSLKSSETSGKAAAGPVAMRQAAFQPMPSERSAKSGIVVPAVVVATITAQYRNG